MAGSTTSWAFLNALHVAGALASNASTSSALMIKFWAVAIIARVVQSSSRFCDFYVLCSVSFSTDTLFMHFETSIYY